MLVASLHRHWNDCRAAFKKALRRDGAKGPVVRRAVIDVANARAALVRAIAAARESKRVA